MNTARGLTALLWLAAACPLAASGGEKEAPSKVLCDFEADGDLAKWSARLASIEVSGETRGVASGRRCLKVSIPASKRWPAVLTQAAGIAGDWSAYGRLEAHFFNTSGGDLWLGIAIADAKASGKGSSALGGGSQTLPPGKSTFVFDIRPTKAKDGHMVDFSAVRELQFYLDQPEKPVTLFIDDLRLAGRPGGGGGGMARTIAGVRAFDFGPANSKAWPGFLGVPAKTVHMGAQGYGWIGPAAGESGGTSPDALMGDSVGWSFSQIRDGVKSSTFAVDLPDGRYWLSTVVTSPVPLRSYHVKAAGVALVDEKIDLKNFAEHLCRFSGSDYPPGTDVFAEYVERKYAPVEKVVQVTGGRLEVEYCGCAAHMLVVAPEEKVEEARAWLAEVRDERKKEFYSRFFREVKPPEPAGEPRIGRSDRARGFIAYGTDYWRETHINTVPADSERLGTMEVAAAQGECEPRTIAVHALEDLPSVALSVSDLVAAGGARIPASDVDVRVVRFFPSKIRNDRNRFRMVPMHLWPANSLRIEKGTTRQFWLTFRAPRDLGGARVYEGTVEVKAEGRPAARLPVRFKVRAFALPEPEEMPVTYAWYYRTPEWRFENWRLGWFKGPEAEERIREVLETELRDMKAHGANAVHLPTPEYLGLTREGLAKLDFSALDRCASVMKRVGIGLKHPNQVEVLRLAGRLMTRAGLKEFSPAFEKAYLGGVTQIRDWARRQDIPVVIWLLDEPRERDLNTWNRNHDDSMRYIALASKVPGIRTTITVQEDTRSGRDYTDMARALDVVQTHPAVVSTKIQAHARTHEKPALWFFNLGKNVNRYAFGFHAWRGGAEGVWQWHYAYWSDPADPTRSITGWQWGVNHMAFLSPEGPVPTVWYEYAREGIDDRRYLARLESEITRAEAGGSAAARQASVRAKARLAEIRARLPAHLPKNVIVGVDGMAYSGELLDGLPKLREEVAGLIEAIRAAR